MQLEGVLPQVLINLVIEFRTISVHKMFVIGGCTNSHDPEAHAMAAYVNKLIELYTAPSPTPPNPHTPPCHIAIKLKHKKKTY
jgi:hypothetical protein